MFLAPSKGEETRSPIAGKVQDFGDKVEERFSPEKSPLPAQRECKLFAELEGTHRDHFLRVIARQLSRLCSPSCDGCRFLFDQPWHSGRMSDAAKLQLGFDLDYGTTQGSPPIYGERKWLSTIGREGPGFRGQRHSPTRSRSPWSRGSRSSSCWAFWSGSSVIHVQGTISQHAAIQSFDCFLRLSVVCHFHECKPARQLPVISTRAIVSASN
jgi:hypothetical protein